MITRISYLNLVLASFLLNEWGEDENFLLFLVFPKLNLCNTVTHKKIFKMIVLTAARLCGPESWILDDIWRYTLRQKDKSILSSRFLLN